MVKVADLGGQGIEKAFPVGEREWFIVVQVWEVALIVVLRIVGFDLPEPGRHCGILLQWGVSGIILGILSERTASRCHNAMDGAQEPGNRGFSGSNLCIRSVASSPERLSMVLTLRR